jgi:hypothetical protein
MMFVLTCGSWVLFRAQSLAQILRVFGRILTGPWHVSDSFDLIVKIAFFAAIPLLTMGYQYLKDFEMLTPQSSVVRLAQRSLVLKGFAYGILTYLLCFYAARAQSFIYFQF